MAGYSCDFADGLAGTFLITNLETGDVMASCQNHLVVFCRGTIETMGGQVTFTDPEMHAAFGTEGTAPTGAAPAPKRSRRKAAADVPATIDQFDLPDEYDPSRPIAQVIETGPRDPDPDRDSDDDEPNVTRAG